jgi:hypothetical protein
MYKNKILCIYENNNELIQFSNIFKNLLTFYGDVYSAYYGNVYNPPFFNVLIYTSNNKKKENYLMCWNMVLINGFLIIPSNKTKYFQNISIIHKFNHKFSILKKTKPKIFIMYNSYRIIDFMIIGVQKAGTTAAMINLAKHPDLDIYSEEMHFFDYHWPKGINWYKNHFNYKKKLVGEKNPNVIYLHYLYPYIQKINPCIKMILFLRNPIDRAYSAWYMFNTKFTNEHNKMTFEQAINNELNYRFNEPLNFKVSNYHLLQRGLYYKQITELLKYFPRQNIYICLSENVIQNMNKEYSKIYDFLDIKHPNNIQYTKEFKGDYTNKNKNISKEIYKKLISFFKNDVKKLEIEILGYKTNWF